MSIIIIIGYFGIIESSVVFRVTDVGNLCNLKSLEMLLGTKLVVYIIYTLRMFNLAGS